MHWFDSMAKAAAGETALDRRGVFKGAAVAAALASPLMTDRTAAAAIRVESRAAQMACENCLNGEIKDLKKTLKNCDKSGNIFGVIPKGKSKGKRPAKAPPIPAAQKIACAMQAQSIFSNFTKKCIQEDCRVPQAKATPPPNAPPGSAAQCPPQTTFCAGALCCFGGDACCSCGGTYTCCAAVIGCTCC